MLTFRVFSLIFEFISWVLIFFRLEFFFERPKRKPDLRTYMGHSFCGCDQVTSDPLNQTWQVTTWFSEKRGYGTCSSTWRGSVWIQCCWKYSSFLRIANKYLLHTKCYILRKPGHLPGRSPVWLINDHSLTYSFLFSISIFSTRMFCLDIGHTVFWASRFSSTY